MDGLGVLRNLRAHDLDIPVILMTFHGSEEIAVEVYRQGVRDYLKKPFTVQEMQNAIDRSLSEARLRRDKDALTERLLQSNRELQRRVQELNVLYSVGKSVTGILDMNELMPRIVDAAVQVTRAEEGELFLLDEGGQLMRCAARRSGAHRALAASESATSPLAARVVETSETIFHVPDDLTAPSMVYAPLVFGGRVVGVLGVTNRTPDARAFSRHDSALLNTLTDYAAIAIENSRNYEGLRQAKERENAYIRATFERLVPPSVVDRILSHPETLELGGRRQEVSVLFADIRGYTAWSEDEPPERVVEMLNEYLSLAAEIVLAWDGTLDKFFGDGLMAIFNAPDEQADHVHRAADAALALRRAAAELGERRGYGLAYSIGINTGEAVVGYIGTERAMNYTAIGDMVNLAKRLQESGAPGQILVEKTVVERLGTLAQARPLGEIRIKGRKQTAFAYELDGLLPLG
jgi:class 3 adenylate cyclase